MWAADADSPPSCSFSFLNIHAIYIFTFYSHPPPPRSNPHGKHPHTHIHPVPTSLPLEYSSSLFTTGNKQMWITHSFIHSLTHSLTHSHHLSLFHFLSLSRVRKLSIPFLPTSSSYYQNLFSVPFCSILSHDATIVHQHCWKNNWWLLLNHSHEFFINLIPLQGLNTRAHTLALSLKASPWQRTTKHDIWKARTNKATWVHTRAHTQVHVQSAARQYRIIYAKHLLAHL